MKNLNKIINTIKFEDILKQYDNKWNLIAKHKYLSDDFINTYFWKLKPFKIEKYQKLSPYIIHKYADTLNWGLLAIYQAIPELLISLNANKVIWKYIAMYQNLSIEFIKKHKNFLKFKDLEKNIRFSQEKLEIIEKIFENHDY